MVPAKPNRAGLVRANIACHRDNSFAPNRVTRQRKPVIPAINGDIVAQTHNFDNLTHIPACFLNAHNVFVGDDFLHRRGLQIHARAPRHIVNYKRQLHGVRDVVKVFHRGVLRALVVIRRSTHNRNLWRQLFHRKPKPYNLLWIVTANPENDWHAPRNNLVRKLGDLQLLVPRHRRRFARRAQNTQRVNLTFDLILDNSAQSIKVHIAVVFERRHKCGTYTIKYCFHVNT